MHLLLIAVVVVVLVWLWLQRPRDGAAGQGWGGDAVTTGQRLAFVARGKLFYADSGEAPREVHSPYVQATMNRLERSRKRHAWKEGTTFGISAMGRARQTGGSVLYSNGYGVFRLPREGSPQVVLRDRLIAGVVAG